MLNGFLYAVGGSDGTAPLNTGEWTGDDDGADDQSSSAFCSLLFTNYDRLN